MNTNNNCWNILGLEPTKDCKLIREKYAALIKNYRPEINPNEFKEIRDAYTLALDFANYVSEDSNIEPKTLYNETASSVIEEDNLTLEQVFLIFKELFYEI